MMFCFSLVFLFVLFFKTNKIIQLITPLTLMHAAQGNDLYHITVQKFYTAARQESTALQKVEAEAKVSKLCVEYLKRNEGIMS